MQITLVSSGDTVCDVLDEFVSRFCFDSAELCSITDSQYLKIRSSIRELKEMTDFLAIAFNVADLAAPKRNSKVSLADWIAKVLLSAREAAASEAIADQVADSSSPEVEVLEPEEKPIYKISIHLDQKINQQGWGFTKESVSALPPYILDRQSNLLKKSSYTAPLCDASYTQVVSQHLSNIVADSGFAIKLMTDNLQVSQACICEDPPPFIVDRGGVYKRDCLKLSLAFRYVQVVSEHLSNIVVV